MRVGWGGVGTRWCWSCEMVLTFMFLLSLGFLFPFSFPSTLFPPSYRTGPVLSIHPSIHPTCPNPTEPNPSRVYTPPLLYPLSSLRTCTALPRYHNPCCTAVPSLFFSSFTNNTMTHLTARGYSRQAGRQAVAVAVAVAVAAQKSTLHAA